MSEEAKSRTELGTSQSEAEANYRACREAFAAATFAKFDADLEFNSCRRALLAARLPSSPAEPLSAPVGPSIALEVPIADSAPPVPKWAGRTSSEVRDLFGF